MRLLLSAVAVAYFVVFPEDLAPLRDILALTNAISPWLYGALLGTVAAWAAVRIAAARTR